MHKRLKPPDRFDPARRSAENAPKSRTLAAHFYSEGHYTAVHLPPRSPAASGEPKLPAGSHGPLSGSEEGGSK